MQPATPGSGGLEGPGANRPSQRKGVARGDGREGRGKTRKGGRNMGAGLRWQAAEAGRAEVAAILSASGVNLAVPTPLPLPPLRLCIYVYVYIYIESGP